MANYIMRHTGQQTDDLLDAAEHSNRTVLDSISVQTAYTSKGSASKVPQITTNAAGQVTSITEVDITAGPTEYVESAETASTTSNVGLTVKSSNGDVSNINVSLSGNTLVIGASTI